MSTQEDEKLIAEDQTLLTENETHDKEEAENQHLSKNSRPEDENVKVVSEIKDLYGDKLDDYIEDLARQHSQQFENQKIPEYPSQSNLLTQSEEDDFVKIENDPPSNEENSDSEEEEESSDEEKLSSSSEEDDSSEEKSSEACKTWLPLLIATFLAFGVLFSLITFYPLTTNSESEWINYANKCCGTHYGQMRCLLDLTCRSKLNRWIDLQPRLSNETNHLTRCCYLYAPYDQSYFFSQYYCDPHCLKPRLI